MQIETNTAIGMARMYQEDPESRSSLTWEVDPLVGEKCDSEMKIISFIYERVVIKKNNLHLNFESKKLREPRTLEPEQIVRKYVSYDDGWPGYEAFYVAVNSLRSLQ